MEIVPEEAETVRLIYRMFMQGKTPYAIAKYLTDKNIPTPTGRSHNCCSPFSAQLKCGDRGEYFGSKVWHSNSKYKRTIWQCNAKFKRESRCAMPHLYEQHIKELFLETFGILMENREEITGDCRAFMEALADCSSIHTELEAVSDEMEVTAGLIQKLVDENAIQKLDQHDYRKNMMGMPAGTTLWRAGWTAWKKSGRGRGSSMTFSAVSLKGLARRKSCRWISMRSCSTGLWITLQSIQTEGGTFRNGAEVGTEI